jgi:formylmethanofuran--tetrahydromethanopterin N-formyltransferase
VKIRGVFIEDTFAEAFGMRAARIIVTARTLQWARAASLKFTGFATSVISCKCEAAVERTLTPDETPDARPGVSVLLFTMDTDSLGKRLIERIGQTVLTCPTTSCFDGLPESPDRLAAGRAIRVFGDRFQISKVIGGVRYWRLPVMEGEFLMSESFGVQKKAVAGGNFLILGEDLDGVLHAAEAAVDAMDATAGVILPFPGGVVRSGSKVGARHYAGMIASTNDAYCPTLKPLTVSRLPGGVNAVLEIVIDGLTPEAVSGAMRAGIAAACRPGVRAITAGNYGGKLGPYQFRLRDIMRRDGSSGADQKHGPNIPFPATPILEPGASAPESGSGESGS